AARLGRGPLLAVQGTREDPRRRRLAAAARTGEEERVRDPPRLQRVDQGADDVLLAGQVLEALRPIFAGENEVRGGHRRRALRVRGTVAFRVPVGARPETGHTAEDATVAPFRAWRVHEPPSPDPRSSA